MALICNLFAGPGTGKSTTMADVFATLKWLGVNCEMAPEFAKEKVWEKSTAILSNQIYVFGKQLQSIFRVNDQVDVVITDSPLLFSLIYAENETKNFENLVVEVFNRYDNLNFLLKREKEYNPEGRLQTEAEAIDKDNEIEHLLNRLDVPFRQVQANPKSAKDIACMVHSRLKMRQLGEPLEKTSSVDIFRNGHHIGNEKSPKGALERLIGMGIPQQLYVDKEDTGWDWKDLPMKIFWGGNHLEIKISK